MRSTIRQLTTEQEPSIGHLTNEQEPSIGHLTNEQEPSIGHLTREQQAAIEKTDGHVCINAIPGSGKTTVLLRRVEYLIRRRQIPEEQVAAVTFTTRAAEHLRQRLAVILGRESRCTIETFHSLCLRIAKIHDASFRVLEGSDQQAMISRLCRAYLDEMPKKSEAASILAVIQAKKTGGQRYFKQLHLFFL